MNYAEEPCSIHLCIDELTTTINEQIRIYFNIEWFKYWLGDESHFDELYFEKVEEYSYRPLTDQDETIIKRKGINLERIIERWINANPTISLDDLEDKIAQHIKGQFKKEDLQQYFENCQCSA
jgi:hypothetical protein